MRQPPARRFLDFAQLQGSWIHKRAAQVLLRLKFQLKFINLNFMVETNSSNSLDNSNANQSKSAIVAWYFHVKQVTFSNFNCKL